MACNLLCQGTLNTASDRQSIPVSTSQSCHRRVNLRGPLPAAQQPSARGVAQLHKLQAAAVAEKPASQTHKETMPADMGLVGLAVMGQNLALNVAEKGFTISVFNRTYEKTEKAVARAKKEGLGDKLQGFEDMKDFVASLQKPRRVMLLVQAGKPVDATIQNLMQYLEEGDIIIDGGNEWYENTEKRKLMVAEKGLLYMGMGVSGGEEGARNGPAMMPGGSAEAYKHIQAIVEKVAAQVDDGPCVTYIGDGGAGNFVKMVHNGIEYGDMQLISEAYDILKTLGGFTNEELCQTFTNWNKTELDSFLIEISALIFGKADDKEGKDGWLLDKILDKTGMKGTGKWTVQQAAELPVAAGTIAASLDGRILSALKDERVEAAKFYSSLKLEGPTVVKGTSGLDAVYASRDGQGVDKEKLQEEVRQALYAAKICSYAQGMNIIKAKSEAMGWGINMGGLARIWKGGCIIRAQLLDDIKQAYDRHENLYNLVVDQEFGKRLAERQAAWRSVVALAVQNGLAAPGMTTSLAYFDTYRRERLPANLVQAQRDFFGSHTYERIDMEGWYHTIWSEGNSADSITTTGYKN